MLRPVLPLAILGLTVTGTLIHAASPGLAPIATIDRIEWRLVPARKDGAEPRIEVSDGTMHSTLGVSNLPDAVGRLAAASPSSPGEAVSFSLVREAGAIGCVGRNGAHNTARGTCRFDPSEAYVAALARRGLRPESSSEALALALVDARVGQADGLARAGYPLREVDDLMTVAALDITPAYVDELRNAGLAIADIDELVTARALAITAAWLRDLATAGYPDLTLDQATAMRALDVTPDYARRMKRVAMAAGELM